MKYLKQPIALAANREDKCKGHFFEQRFYSGALLDDEAVLAAMCYVDLNPVRARIARSIEDCRDSAIQERLAAQANRLEKVKDAITPLASGVADAPVINVNFSDYCRRLRMIIDVENEQSDAASLWRARMQCIAKKQRAYGAAEVLNNWADQRGWSRAIAAF